MSVRGRLWQLPLRLPTGAYMLDAGVSKWDADEATAKYLHDFTAGTYPVVKSIEPAQFVKAVSAGEIALGTILLAPFVPGRLAGAGLTAYAAALLGLYVKTPGMRRPSTPFPSKDGIALAKDSWLLGIGLALLFGRASDGGSL
ncbi:hypothetical protein GCM10010464_28890 [Pseudonocardia yunnanensis]|uniref:DoxX family membrane protein n=1 Tax=Pseudonocardia yunnanensis TaxID=58107 RepID=A0ABW4F176_9PSEU